jgi:xanthine dehydrogenase accessory factor
MKEIKDIIQAYEIAKAAGKKTALATVVHVEGSSYRRPGARMLVTEDGLLTGAISGGCLEGDALRKALLAINAQENKLVTYDTADEDDARFGVQLGCNGIVHILFEPIRDDAPEQPILLLKRVAAQRNTAILVTLFSLENKGLQPGLCMLSIGEESWSNFVAPINIQEDLVIQIAAASVQGKSIMKQYKNPAGALCAYIELLHPPISLVICGAGNDAIPLVRAANLIGFEAIVIDGRPTHASLQRFPEAKAVRIATAEQALAQVQTDHRTAWVLMTHNYNYDLEVLRQLLEIDCRYVGILGPKKKLQRMLDELVLKGTVAAENRLENIYSPVGLDIGAETAEEIAFSIIAEIQAVFAGKKAQFLKNKEDSIHNRTDQHIASSK